MMDEKDYEEQIKALEKRNQKLLDVFHDDLKARGFTNRTINRHLDNVDFYINIYLPREGVYRAEEGVEMIGSFLGYFFIYKCMWSTPASIKSTAASIKKFYKSMLDHGYIEKGAYEYFCNVIKENMEEWQSSCAAFNNGESSLYSF